MWTWFNARQAAKRLNLRDRGWTSAFAEAGKQGVTLLIHPFCQTRLRIGVCYGKVTKYCWKCELITEEIDVATSQLKHRTLKLAS